MRLFPAIDLMGGEVVRLSQGRADSRVVYERDPRAQARRFVADGATHLHVVDLDAAFGKGDNRRHIAEIVQIAGKSGARVQVGGGLRDLADIARLLAAGVWRVVVGSAAVERPELIGRAVRQFGAERVCVGLDARDGEVRIKGWTEGSSRSALDVGRAMAEQGVGTLIYTDIARDGMLDAPDIDGAVELGRATGCGVVVSGGVARLAHLRRVAQTGPGGSIEGVIVGKALYEGRFALTEALAALRDGGPQARDRKAEAGHGSAPNDPTTQETDEPC
jgi:phosphoribosylformimino-5-aminoimidazole carboxamide ribotide isomerase